MRIKTPLIGTFLFSGFIVAALATYVTAFGAPEERTTRSISGSPVLSLPETGGCPVWGGRRLRSTNSDVMTVQFTVGLGRVSNRGNTASITLIERIITRNSYTPDILSVSASTVGNDIELVRDPLRPQRVIADPGEKGGYTSQSIKQIRTPQTFVDIVVLSEWEYEIRFYRPEQVGPKQQGFYTVSGGPFSVSRIRNPNPPSTDSLEITYAKDAITKKTLYKYDKKSDAWIFFDNDVETGRKLSAINPNDPCERIETRFDLEDGRWLKTIKVYKGFAWGQELVKMIEDPDGEARTTTYKYWDDPKGPHYTFLKTTIHPDGRIQPHNRGPDPFQHLPKRP